MILIKFFCDKQNDGSFSLTFEFTNGKILKSNYNENPFIKSYLSNLNLRTACINCSFKQVHRCSDITLGDFWGVERVCPELADEKGVSLVFAHSEKGEIFVNKIINQTYIKVADFKESIIDNAAYLYSSKENVFRQRFLKKVNKNNFTRLVNKYAGMQITVKIRRKLRTYI